tara:strand:- start:974 stop:1219 length:246 start_codon:yes stop_codon:yes gene_type:complete
MIQNALGLTNPIAAKTENRERKATSILLKIEEDKENASRNAATWRTIRAFSLTYFSQWAYHFPSMSEAMVPRFQSRYLRAS